MKYEFWPVVSYTPDFEKIRSSKIKIYSGAGEESIQGDRFYAQSAKALAEQLNTEFVQFKGNHFSFFDYPTDFRALCLRLFS